MLRCTPNSLYVYKELVSKWSLLVIEYYNVRRTNESFNCYTIQG